MVGLLDVTNSADGALMPFLAMLGGILTICTVYLFHVRKISRLVRHALSLQVLGFLALLSGIMISIIANLDTSKTDYIVSWLNGKVSGGNCEH